MGISLSLGAELDYALSGRRSPECLHYNVAGIYENLKWFVLPDGGFVYPNGQDWQLFRNADWTVKSVMMSVLLRDPDAWSLACRCVETLEKMQARSNAGTVYAPGETFSAGPAQPFIPSVGGPRSWPSACPTGSTGWSRRTNSTGLGTSPWQISRSPCPSASNQDGSFTMREKLVALTDVTTTRIATGQIGILNNPGWVYERGRRTVAIDGREW